MNSSNDFTFKFDDINNVIPNATILNKTFRKFRTVCSSKHSKEFINFSCFYAFLSYCIEESIPKDNKMRMLKYSLGKCLYNNQKFINKKSQFDDMFIKEYFKKFDHKLQIFIEQMKSKLGANGVLSERKNFHRNLLTLFYGKEDIANVIAKLGNLLFYV